MTCFFSISLPVGPCSLTRACGLKRSQDYIILAEILARAAAFTSLTGYARHWNVCRRLTSGLQVLQPTRN